MKRIALAALAAFALSALPTPAKANGPPLGFTIGGAGSLSFFISPFVPSVGSGDGCGHGGGCGYPGYIGCCSNGMMPAYAYLGGFPGAGYGNPGYGYGGYPGYDNGGTAAPQTAPQPTPGSGNGNGNGTNGNGTNGNSNRGGNVAPQRTATPPGYYYPQQGYAYYPYAGYPYQAPPYWMGR